MFSVSHRPSLSSLASFSSADLTDIPLADLAPDTSRLLPQRPVRHHVRVQGKVALVRSISAATLRRPASACPSPALPPPALCRNASAASPPVSAPTSPNPAVALRRQARRPLAFDHGVAGVAVQRRSLDIPQALLLDKSPVGAALVAEPQELAADSACAVPQTPEHTGASMPDDLEEEERQVLVMRDGQLRGYGIGGAGNIRRATDPYGVSTTPKKRSLRDILGLGVWTDGRQINGGIHSPRH